MSVRPATAPAAPPRRPPLHRRAREVGMSPNHWYPVAFGHELRRGAVLGTAFQGEPLAVYRAEDGVAHVVEDRCAHRHIKLSHGSVEGCNLVCLYHGWTYGPDGRLVGTKHDDFGKRLPVLRIGSYPTRERYGIVWFFPGDRELAATTPLVEIPHAEGPGRWASLTFAYTWAAHHSMVIDNLCNLTHLWVHGRWVPYGDTVLSGSSAEGDRLTLRWTHDLRRDLLHPLVAPVFRKAKGSNESETLMVYDYPYQSAVSNDRIRSTNFMLPVDARRTRVFTLQLWAPPRTALGRVPPGLFQLAMPLVRPITKEIFRQDGFTVEEEQRAYAAHADRPFPEPNPMVRRFNELTVRKWDEYEAFREAGVLTEAQLSEQRRTKVL